MKREKKGEPELIDLGAVSAETRGPTGIYLDEVLAQQKPGLAAD